MDVRNAFYSAVYDELAKAKQAGQPVGGMLSHNVRHCSPAHDGHYEETSSFRKAAYSLQARTLISSTLRALHIMQAAYFGS